MAPPIPFTSPTVSTLHRRLPTALRGLLGHVPALRAGARSLWTWLAAGPWAGLRSARQVAQWGALVLVLLMLLLGSQRGGQGSRPGALAHRAPAPSAGRVATRPAAPRVVRQPLAVAGPLWAVVSGTGGVGLSLRRSPGLSARVVVLPEGTGLQTIGPRVSAAGLLWQQVRDPAGRIGWVAAAYLTMAVPPRAYRVAATGGLGLYLRGKPAGGALLRAWPDGTLLAALGSGRAGAGERWLAVRDPAGHDGWAPARYLAPVPRVR